LELFFDLVFVVALARAAATLHHAAAENHLAEGLLLFAMAFFGIWWAWMNFTWFASAYDTDDVPYRLLAFVQLTGALIFTAAVGERFAGTAFPVGVFGYVIMRVALIGQWIRASRQDPDHRVTARRYAVGIALVQALWVGAIWAPEAWRVGLFFALVLAELSVPMLAERARGTPWHPEHIAERYGLFLIIVLGESVLSASLAIEAITSTAGFDVGLLPVLGGGLLLLFGMWWIYFDGAPVTLLESTRGAWWWGYGHLFVFAAGAAVGAGIAVAADHASQHAEITRLLAGMMVAVPAAVFLLSLWVLHLIAGTSNRTSGLTLGAIAVISASPWTGQAVLVSGLAMAGLVAATLARRHREAVGRVAVQLGVLAAGSVLAIDGAHAQARSPAATQDSLVLRSTVLAEARPIHVYLPAAHAHDATRRFPVLYMPDGGTHEDFPHVVATVDSLIALGAIRPVIVVGIANTERRRDMTGPTRVASDRAIAPRVGGSAAFRHFIATELIPLIDGRYRTTPERVIIGESLAGLFIVETLVERPELFTGYVALDPSLWWNDGALLDRAAERLPGMPDEERTLFLASSDVREIAEPVARLAELYRTARRSGTAVHLHQRPDLGHATIYRAMKVAGLEAVLR
jgi:low temperature requirement protein LtrA/predicted alpha/beta superfamily hydrolase